MNERRTATSIEDADADKPMRAKYVRVAIAWAVSFAGLWLLQFCYGG